MAQHDPIYPLYIPYISPIYPLYIPYIGVRDTLTGYVVPGHVGDGTWLAWENSSAAAAVAVAVVAHIYSTKDYKFIVPKTINL